MKTKGKPTDLDKIIGNNLKEIRMRQRLSQRQIATICDVTFQQIQKYERGTNRLSASRLAVISNKLNIDIRYFYSGTLDEDDKKTVDRITSYTKKELELLEIISKTKDKSLINSLIVALKSS